MKQCDRSRSYYTSAMREFGVPKFDTEIVSIFPSKMASMGFMGSMGSVDSMDSMDSIYSVRAPSLQLHQHRYPRELVFLGGAPGAGKGTNAAYITGLKTFNAPPIVISDLLNTPACKFLKDRGMMVDDEFVFNTLLRELEKPIYRNGVVIDGFPRTAKQVEYLSHFYDQLDSSKQCVPPSISFIMLHIDETTSVNRQQGRGKQILAANKERCSLKLQPLEVRATDLHVDASKARYAVFEEQLSAIMELGNQFPIIVVDASATIDVVRSNLANEMAVLY